MIVERIKQGHAVSKGIGLGRAFVYKRYIPLKKISYIEDKDVESAFARYHEILQKAHQEIDDIRQSLEQKGDDKAKIFTAHLDILHDIALEEMIEQYIKQEHFSIAYAVHEAFDMFIEIIGQVEDELIRERVADLKDVKNRVLRIEEGLPETNLSRLSEPSIIIADDLYPSDTATLDRTFVEALITEIGGVTSHTAIIAKSYEIPAILGIEGVMKTIEHGTFVIADAIKGELIIHPDAKTTDEYTIKKKEYKAKQTLLKTYLPLKPITQDLIKVEVTLNIGSASDEELSFVPYVDGVGLFRSEFLYMENDHLPTEDEQYHVYAKALKAFGEKPVILRTLDIGGDKELSYLTLPKEDNPFLGCRAIRLCFEHPEILKTQLRAALRASVYGNLWLMFPMVGSIDDIEKIHHAVGEAKASLDHENIMYSQNVKVGVMIEIPSLILIADHVAKMVDFASIGTNDLCQYLTAVDRLNPLVSSYYQSYSPAMFRIIKMAIDAFNKEHKPISVCGELGGDPIAAPILLGLGMRKISMAKSSVARIKKIITSHQMTTFSQVADHILKLTKEKDVIDYVQSVLKLED
ncbi:MAG: phosphoenolpyruvate--protein phosphotransferase [Acholeplasma sp.]|nr:MAG: phosphoenolpyruvate--protein phosphotransferase [Acholeplasma sp.]